MLLCWSWPEGDATEAGEFDWGVWYEIGGYGLCCMVAAIMSPVSAAVYPLVAPGVL
jgi:hypothetical protein